MSRSKPPTDCTDLRDALPFKVWAEDRAYEEDPYPWKVVGAFRYLTESIEYIQGLNRRGVTGIVHQTPASCGPTVYGHGK